MANLSAVSLFTGAGGMDIGFADAGFNIQIANEIDPIACQTYATLNPDVELLCESITNRKVLGSIADVVEPDIVFGGPPCQGFSVAGKMDPNDARSQLIWTFFDVVEASRPRSFVCENVKSLGAHSRWANTRSQLLQRAEEMGYCATIVILNASDFGVPQNRERMFLIGFRQSNIELPSPRALHRFLLSQLSHHVANPPTISQIVGSLGKAGCASNPRECGAKVTFAKNPVLRPSPYAGMMFNGAGRPIRAFGFSCTLPASMGGNKTPIVDDDEIFDGASSFIERYHRHLRKGGKPRVGDAPKRLRRLTVDECLAIQTFPAGMQMAGRRSAMYRQIGNAVPCKLAQAVGSVVREILMDGGVAECEIESNLQLDLATAG
jgi:DNA (cytosine-5)-methyltransferase 1